MVLVFIDHEVNSPPCSSWLFPFFLLVCVHDWKHFRIGDWQQVRGARSLKSVHLIDPVHILKIKEGIKGIAKLLKTPLAPKKGTNDSVNKQSRWRLLVGAITPFQTPVTPQTKLLKASILMPDSSMAPSLTGTCLSLDEAKAAQGNLQFKLISLLSQRTVDT